MSDQARRDDAMRGDAVRELAIFEAALELADPAQRLAHVQEACGSDEALRRQVESLLAAHERPGAFLDVPACEQVVGRPAAARLVEPFTSLPTIDLNEPEDAPVPPPDRAADDTSPEQADDKASILAVLQPSTRPDALGRLGHYEVLEVLGQGGFGTVVKGFDEKLHRMVAIKIMAPHLAATSPARKRFLREARSSAAIRHENVVDIHAIEEQPIPFLVMEYVAGETLQRRLDRTGPLEAAEALRIGVQIAHGLAAAHAMGKVHRDIKPANILLENGVDRVKITDFGLARAADDASLTQSGVIAGTPMYMAPEQAQGVTVDQRADLFSFGSVLYLMCSGRPPFRAANTLAVLKRVAEDGWRPIREIIPEVPQWLCDIITKLHAKDPADRFTTAKEVADLLGRYLAELQLHGKVQTVIDVLPRSAPVTMQPSTQDTGAARVLPTAPRSPARSRGRRLALAAAVLLCMVGGLAVTEATGVTNVGGTVISLFLPEGTLLVEVDDPEVSVTVEGEEVIIKGAGAKEIRMKPGQYKVQATKDGKVVRQELVTVARNGRQIVRISREPIVPPEGAANSDGPKSQTPKPQVETPGAQEKRDVERAVAVTVLKAGGWVYVNIDKQRLGPIDAASKLPAEPFVLSGIAFRGKAAEDVGDGLLAACQELSGLTTLGVPHSAITNAGLARLLETPACQRITSLDVSDTVIGDAGLVSLAKLKGLEQLNARNCPRITDKTMAQLKGLPLKLVALDRTAVTNNGLSNLRGMKLTYLSLSDCTGFDDAGLVALKDMTTLVELRLEQTRVGNGLRHLLKNAGLTDLRISGTRLTEAGLEGILGLEKLSKLFVADLPVSDRFLSRLNVLPNVKLLQLSGSAITNEGLEHLKALPGLDWLAVRNTQVTAEAALRFSRAVPVCDVFGPTVFLPAWAADKAAVETLRPAGATVILTLPAVNGRHRITPKMEVPLGPFRLVHVDMIQTQPPAGFVSDVLIPALTPLSALDGLTHVPVGVPVSADDLNRLADSPVGATLRHFYAHDCELSAETLAALKRFKLTQLLMAARTASEDLVAQLFDIPGLSNIHLNHLPHVGPATRAQLGRLPLVSLGFDHCRKIDRDLCQRLGRMATLSQLNLADTNLESEWLAEIAESASIQQLQLMKTSLDDAGLEHLARLKSLRRLTVYRCNVTRPGLDKLAARLPMCTIVGDGFTIEPTISPDPERRAAEHVLALGGKVRVDSQRDDIDAAAGLPPGSFRLFYVNLGNNKQVGDADLANFKECRHLFALYLGGTDISAAGLAQVGSHPGLTNLILANTRIGDDALAVFKDCKKLSYLNLAYADVGDAGLEHFKNCRALKDLRLPGMSISDAGLAHFKDNKDLTTLHLYDTKIGDAGLAHFKDCKNLSVLHLHGTDVTDASQAFLLGCKKLTYLRLHKTSVSAALIDALKVALPACKIEWDGGTIEPAVVPPALVPPAVVPR